MDAISVWLIPRSGPPARLRVLGSLLDVQERVDEASRSAGFVQLGGYLEVSSEEEGAPPQFYRQPDPLSVNAREVWYVEAAPPAERAWARGEE